MGALNKVDLSRRTVNNRSIQRNSTHDKNNFQKQISIADAIVNGKNSAISEAPYLASVRMFRRHVCGGVIIDKLHVLTCGHCVTMTGGDVYSVHVGNTLLMAREAGTQERSVRRVTLHKDYSPRLLRNDIAILTMASEFQWTPVVQPAKLVASNQRIVANEPAHIWGWGLSQEGKNGFSYNMPSRLKSAKMITTSNDACKKIYQGRFVPPEVACVASASTRQDACQGDHGGPIAIGDHDDPMQKQVYCLITWALGCNRGYPRVCINLAHYRGWIDSVVNGTIRRIKIFALK